MASFAIDSEAQLWAWGSSAHGQLGLGPERLSSPVPARVEAGALAGCRVAAVAAGWGHAVAICSGGQGANNRLVSWGFAADGRLGYDHPPASRPPPSAARTSGSGDGAAAAEPPLGPAPFNSRSAAAEQRVAAQLLAASAEVEDELASEAAGGLPINWMPREAPLAALAGDDAEAAEAGGVACGGDHTLVLTRGGTLLAFGENSHGQLGRAGSGPAVVARGASAPFACGLAHSLAMLQGGRLASWGWAAGGQLGRRTIADHDPKPSPIEGIGEGADAPLVVQARSSSSVLLPCVIFQRVFFNACPPSPPTARQVLSAGRAHSVALDGCGRLFAWGSNRNGRCGLGQGVRGAEEPEEVSVDGARVLAVAAGLDHTVALTS